MKIYTIIRWKYESLSWECSKKYVFKSILKSFKSRTDAINYIKEKLGAKYNMGYYLKGDYLYTIKQTDLL